MNLDTAEDLLNFSLVQAAPPVLFCTICNKPFSQETALKRHVAIGELNLYGGTQDTGTLCLPAGEAQDWISSYNLGGVDLNRLTPENLAVCLPNEIDGDTDMILSGRLHEIAISGMVNDCTISSISRISFPLSSIRPHSAAVQASASVIRQSLAAYPQMMLRRSTFPPFIHPHQDKSKLPVPLSNCMGIAVLYAARNKDTQAFLWKTIRDEQERCLREMTGWSKYDVFAAMQSQLIYIMMRVVDGCCGGEVQGREYNTNMLLAYKGFWSQLIALDMTSCDAAVSKTTEWDDWILEESLTRVACVWFLVAQISSSQWTANTSDEWKEETEALSSMRNLDKRPVTFGDLYELNKGANHQAVIDRLDVWNAGVDNLGVLLNVAVNMI
ncbi:hypothetical protein CGCF415_v015268 [Colletotrichum fructicola]|nr:hypothetical protein CGCFRS4_v015117 [Colletotrichum fructicola]KAF4885997.1 hypothetical protein CGCF415_v015268 [Colletotrichum fructicola]KAF4922876.1 hypothetical protein CGCF245_v015158 [Colletotrichum fructicola]